MQSMHVALHNICLSQDKWRNLNMEAKEQGIVMIEADNDPDFKVSTAFVTCLHILGQQSCAN